MCLSESISVVLLITVVGIELRCPPMLLVHLPQLIHLLIYCVGCFSSKIKPGKFQSTEEVLLDLLHPDCLVRVDDSVHKAPAAREHISLFHVTADVPVETIL